MTFASPQILFLLLILLPLIAYIGWPRYAFRRRRDVTSLILRSVLMILLVLALAGAQIVRTVDKLAVVFLVDASDSVGVELREAQLDYIREAVANKPPDDEWAIVVFGGDVSIDRPFSNVTEVSAIRSTVPGSNTNLAEGIQTAISLFPADARRRVVILSDGRQTLGNAEAKAQLAEASGVEISYALFARESRPDVRITDFNAPEHVFAGQEFDLTVTIEADEATPATLIIHRSTRDAEDEQRILEQDIQLNAGTNRFTIPRRASSGNFLNFTAQVSVDNARDEFTQNNQREAFSRVQGPPRILVISNDPADIEHLVPALQETGFELDVVSPSNFSTDTRILIEYDSVVIVDVPATQLSNRQMERLQTYVRDLGGGLVFIGGIESYGPGGYFRTALEEALPLETQIKDRQRLPQLTLAYLVDRSGSMSVSNDGIFTNLQLAQRAIVLSIDFLQPTDRVAVGTFESRGSWVVEFQEVGDKRPIQDMVNTLLPGGGTDIMAGMRLVERDIVNEPSERKHLVLITDGGASSIGLVELADQLNQENDVTLSVIAIGSSVPYFLRQMAEKGQGNYHAIQDVGQIPNILAQETVLATRSYISEGDFSLVRTANNPILEGIGSLPNLQGYVATTGKDTAQVVLRGPTPYSDPILATWQYGLGRSVAFTGDATARWAAGWVQWEGYPRFWSQVINYSITEMAENNIERQIVLEDDRARLIVDARGDDGTFLNGLNLMASVQAPDASTRQIALQQVAPGRYEATFRPEYEGAYFVALFPAGSNQVLSRVGWSMSYSAEYADTRPDERLLASLATITGGQSLQVNPMDVFAITQEPRTAAAPIWPWLLLMAILLLPFDIAVRRIIITRSDLRRLRAYLAGEIPTGPDERISSLMSARERARERIQFEESDSGAIAALRKTRKSRESSESAAQDIPSKPRTPPASQAPIRQERPERSTSTVSNLLKRRRGDEEDT